LQLHTLKGLAAKSQLNRFAAIGSCKQLQLKSTGVGVKQANGKLMRGNAEFALIICGNGVLIPVAEFVGYAINIIMINGQAGIHNNGFRAVADLRFVAGRTILKKVVLACHRYECFSDANISKI
jgi:hypothetical protein